MTSSTPTGAASAGEAEAAPVGDTYKPESPAVVAHRLGLRHARTNVTNDELIDLAVAAYWRNRHLHLGGEAA